MELNRDNIQAMSESEIFDCLKPNLDKIYQLYCYLVSIEDYKKMVLKVIKDSHKVYEEDENYFDYVEKQVKTSLDEKVNKLLKNKRTTFSVINNYINTNFVKVQSYQDALTYFKQLDKFFQEYQYFPDMLLWTRLIKNNTYFLQMIILIMEHFYSQIIAGKASMTFHNDTLVLVLEIYCSQKNIEIANVGSFEEEEYGLGKEEEYTFDEDVLEYPDVLEYGFGEEEDGSDDEEEAEQFEAIDGEKFYRKIISQYPLLPREEEKRLAILVKQNDAEARELFIKSNLGLVISIAKKYAHKCTSSLSMEDLIQEGSIGLMKALDNFNAKKGCKFSTYATWWINQAISRAIDNKSDAIRRPCQLLEQVSKFKRTVAILSSKLYRDPTLEEVAQEMNLPLSAVQKIYDSNRDIISLYTKTGEGEETELLDFVPDPKYTPEDTVLNNILGDFIEKIFEDLQLPELTKEVMRRRYGLHGEIEMSWAEIGREFHCSYQNVATKGAIGLKKIRQSEWAEQLLDYAQDPQEAYRWLQEIREAYAETPTGVYRSYVRHKNIFDKRKRQKK